MKIKFTDNIEVFDDWYLHRDFRCTYNRHFSVLRPSVLRWLISVPLAALSFMAVGEPVDLEYLKQQLAGKHALTANFEQTRHLKLLSKPLRSSGQFVYHDASGICWDIKTPYPVKIIINDESLVQKDAAMGEQAYALNQNPLFGTISGLFSAVFQGDFSTVEKHFQMSLTGERENWSIHLIPSNTLIQKVYAAIDITGGDWIQKVTLLDPKGDQTDIQFQIPEVETSLEPSTNASACFQ